MDYPGNVSRDHLRLVVHVLRVTVLRLIMIEGATLLVERSARASDLKFIKYNPLRDVTVVTPRYILFRVFTLELIHRSF